MKKFHNKLFITYFSIIILSIVFLSSIYIFYLSRVFRENSLESLKLQSQNISKRLEEFVRDMDRITVQLATNVKIKENLQYNGKSVDLSEKLYRNREVDEIISNTISPWFLIRQVNIFNYDNFYGMGLSRLDEDKIYKNLHNVEWIRDVIEKKGGKYIVGPHEDDWSYDEEMVVSLCRYFVTRKGFGIVEVQQRYSKLESLVNEFRFSKNHNIYIFSEDGTLIYPASEDGSSQDFLISSITGIETGLTSVYNQNKKEKMLVSTIYSDYSKLKVVNIQLEHELFSPLKKLKYTTVIIVTILLVVSFLVSYFIARKITHSIQRIKNDVNNLSLENLNIDVSKDYSGMDELNQLQHAFKNMGTRLKESLELVKDAQTKENMANMAAFQSQINPHFLYNTLAVISAKGYESNAPEVEEMCTNLSSMLRYITDSTSFTVVMNQEIEYVKYYLRIIKKRYEERFKYYIEADENLANVQIPKMIIQPIIENCIVHGFDESITQLTIKIKAKIVDGNKWVIEIEDNGRGFSEEALGMLDKQISEIMNEAGLMSIMNQKVGLINTYIRLYLVYREKLVFDIKTGIKGSKVSIGGCISV